MNTLAQNTRWQQFVTEMRSTYKSMDTEEKWDRDKEFVSETEKNLARKAMELLEFCRKELDGYEKDFNTILNDGQL